MHEQPTWSDEPIFATTPDAAPKTPDEAIVGGGFTLLDAGLFGVFSGQLDAMAIERAPEPPARMEPRAQTLDPYLRGDEYPVPTPGGAFGSGGGAALSVQEVDGTPSVANVDTIKVPNGTLTDLGSGDVSLSYENPANKGVASGYAGLDGSGLVPRAQLPAAVAYEDEANAFTALNQFKDVELDDQDGTPVADRRLRVIDGLIRASDTSQVEGRHVSRLSLEQITDAEVAASGITTRSKLPAAIAYEDEANAFTALNQFKDVELDDQDGTPVADRRLRVVDGLIRATDTSQVEGRHVSRASLQSIDQIRTTSGPTDLSVGAVADGELLQRVGSSVVGIAQAGVEAVANRVLRAERFI